jgi:hypothetical protein
MQVARRGFDPESTSKARGIVYSNPVTVYPESRDTLAITLVYYIVYKVYTMYISCLPVLRSEWFYFVLMDGSGCIGVLEYLHQQPLLLHYAAYGPLQAAKLWRMK